MPSPSLHVTKIAVEPTRKYAYVQANGPTVLEAWQPWGIYFGQRYHDSQQRLVHSIGTHQRMVGKTGCGPPKWAYEPKNMGDLNFQAQRVKDSRIHILLYTILLPKYSSGRLSEINVYLYITHIQCFNVLLLVTMRFLFQRDVS